MLQYSSLIHSFENNGLSLSNELNQDEFRLLLNDISSTGYFDSNLCDKLFHFLKFNENITITIKDFIKGFILYEKQIKRNIEINKIKLNKEQDIYNEILKECIKYKNEKLNEEGFSENAKIYGEITDIDIKKKLIGIKEIIILIIYNNKKEEIHFKIGDDKINYKKEFEFKILSRKDHFEFIMKGINDNNKIFNIGNKIFSLNNIESQEKYIIQITIPELENSKKIAAYIDISIILYMSYYNYYESLRKKEEKKLKKYKILLNEKIEYLDNINDIYGDLSEFTYELNDGFNTQRGINRINMPLNSRRKSKGFYSPNIDNRKISNYDKYDIKQKKISKIIYHHSPIIQRKENISINHIKNFNDIQKISNYSPPKSKRIINQDIKHLKYFSNDIDNIPQNIKNAYIIRKEDITRDKNKNINHHIKSQSELQQILHNQNIMKKSIKIVEQIKKEKYQNISSIPQYIQVNKKIFIKQGVNNINNNHQQTKKINVNNNIQKQSEYNLNKQQNTKITTTNIQNNNIKNNLNEINKDNKVIYEMEKATIHQVVGDILKQKTITAEVQILKPVIKKVININNSVNKAIINQIINKEIIQENTLPISYLPSKVNELIYLNKINTLPIINAGNKVTYKTLEPFIHESNIHDKKEKNIINNINISNNIIDNSNIFNYSVDAYKNSNYSDVDVKNNKGNISPGINYNQEKMMSEGIQRKNNINSKINSLNKEIQAEKINDIN